MTKKNVVLIILLAVLAMLLVGCDEDLNDVEDFLNESDVSKAVNDTVDNITDSVEDYAVEMFDDAADMTSKLTEGNIPDVSPETSQNMRELVIENLDTVGQAVLDVDTAANELQACFAQCDGDYPDIAGSKVIANVNCVADCKGK